MSDAAASQTILIAFDGSEPARAAANVAIQLARSQACGVAGLYVVDEALIMDPYAKCDAELGSTAERKSREDLIARFQRRGEDVLAWLTERCRVATVPSSVELVLGSVPDVMLRQAEHTQLLALGRSGHGHVGNAQALGHHFRAIAHSAPCTLVVGGAAPRELRRLLLAYNGGERANRALTWIARARPSLAADVVVLSVQAAGGAWADTAREQLAHDDLSHYQFLTRAGDPAATIAAVAAETQADCIFMGGYRHTAAVEWLVGSTVDGVLTQVALPVVVA